MGKGECFHEAGTIVMTAHYTQVGSYVPVISLYFRLIFERVLIRFQDIFSHMFGNYYVCNLHENFMLFGTFAISHQFS